MSAALWVLFWLVWSAAGARWLVSLHIPTFIEAPPAVKAICLIAAGPVVWAAVLAALVWVSS